MQIQNNRARAATNARALAVLDVSAGGSDATIEADCGAGVAQGGYAVYFRVTDANNWWRLAVNASSYFRPSTGTTSYSWELVLQKCVAGVVTNVSSSTVSAPTHLKVVASGTSIIGLCATTDNAVVTQQITTVDAFNQFATKHGLGYSETTSYGNVDGFDNFQVISFASANTPPNAPTSLSPSGSNLVDRNLVQRLSWVFTDPNPGDAQTRFDLQYRTGTGAYTTVSKITSDSFYDLPAGTLAAADFKWGVITYDSKSAPSQPSAPAYFTAFGPTIVAPTQGVVVPRTAPLTWAVTGQQSYQVRSVADLNGAPDTSTVFFDSAEVTDTSTRTVQMLFPVNGRTEHLQVRVKINGQFTAWADVRVVVVYVDAAGNTFDSTPFTAVAVDYSSVAVTWRRPGGDWSRQRLVRNTTGFPLTVGDGVVLLDRDSNDTTTSYTDAGLSSARFFYYALFVLDTNSSAWRLTGEAEVLVPKDYGYTQRLYDRLPEAHKTSDFSELGQPIDTGSFLYRYLSVFGNALDFIRTEYEALRRVLDARTVSLSLLPSLAAQVGVGFEPQVGGRAQRRLVQNAVHLYGMRGTNPGVRELASVVTGWDSGVRLGYNLALDDCDAGPKGSEGRWCGFDGSASVTYAARRLVTVPDDSITGFFDIQATGGRPDAVVWMCRAPLTEGMRRLQYAIPIVQDRTYTVSEFTASTNGVSNSRASKMQIVWLDVAGVPIGGPVNGFDQITSGVFTARPYLTAVAPPGARYLEARLVFTAQNGMLTAGERFRACGFMVSEDTVVFPWQCAREVIVQLRAEASNDLPHTNPGPMGAPSWVSDAGLDTVDPTRSFFVGQLTTNTSASVHAFPGGYYTAGDRIDLAAGQPVFLTAEVGASAPSRGAAFCVITFGQGGTPTFSVLPSSVVQDIAVGSAFTTVTAQLPPAFFPGNVKQVVFGLVFFSDRNSGTSQPTFSSGETVRYRNIGVFNSETPVDFFDGGVPSPTGDNLWEAAQYASRSYRYTQRTSRSYRLRQLLADFLPAGSCFAFEFAQARQQVIASTASVKGVEVNTGPSTPPGPVGKSVDLVWSQRPFNSAGVMLQWRTLAKPVGVSANLTWNLRKTAGATVTALWVNNSFFTHVAAQRAVVWAVRQTSAFGVAPSVDANKIGWTNTTQSTDSFSLTNVSDGDYVYAGFGPMRQTGTFQETGIDGVVRSGTWAIPNSGGTAVRLFVLAPGGQLSSVRDSVFLGVSGEVIYHWYNRTASFLTPRILALAWNVNHL